MTDMLRSLTITALAFASSSCVAGNFISSMSNTMAIADLKEAVTLSELPGEPIEIAEFCGVSESGRVSGPLFGNARSSYQLIRESDHWLIHWHMRGKPRPNERDDFGAATVLSDSKWRGIRSVVLRLAHGEEHPQRGIRLRVLCESKRRRDGQAVSYTAQFPPEHLSAFALAPTVGSVPRDAHCGALGLEHLLVKR